MQHRTAHHLPQYFLHNVSGAALPHLRKWHVPAKNNENSLWSLRSQKLSKTCNKARKHQTPISQGPKALNFHTPRSGNSKISYPRPRSTKVPHPKPPGLRMDKLTYGFLTEWFKDSAKKHQLSRGLHLVLPSALGTSQLIYWILDILNILMRYLIFC